MSKFPLIPRSSDKYSKKERAEDKTNDIVRARVQRAQYKYTKFLLQQT